MTIWDTSVFFVACAALVAGCADGTVQASKSLSDPSNPRAPEAAVANEPALGSAPKVGAASDMPEDMSGMKHDVSGMKHDMGAMQDGGAPKRSQP